MAISTSFTKNAITPILLAISFVIAGIILIFIATTSTLYAPPKITNTSLQEFSQLRSYPKKLYIPKLAKALDIAQGQVVNNRWTVSQTGVSYLSTSAIPGQIGNSVIYGHNRPEILGGLTQVKNSDLVFVVMENGHIVKYRIIETRQIKPTQVEILNNSPDSRLTIYTCSGFLDQARFVVIAKEDHLL